MAFDNRSLGFGGPTISSTRAPRGVVAVPTLSGVDYVSGGLKEALIGGAIGFLTGGPVGAVTGAAAGLTQGGGAETGGFADLCPDGSRKVLGKCFDFQPGGATQGQGLVVQGLAGSMDFGEAVRGQYGVALVPGSTAPRRLRCPPGAILGKDELCYNKRDLRKSERKWVPGPKPPVTGHEAKLMRTYGQNGSKVRKIQRLAQSAGLTSCQPKKKPVGRKKK